MTNTSDSQVFKNRDAASYDALTNQFDYFTESLCRPLAERIIKLAEIDSHNRVLDVGTGTGVVALRIGRFIDQTATVCGIDLSNEMLKKALEKAQQLKVERRVSFHRMDAENLAFKEESFDVVVSLFALLHFPNPLIALREIFRVLRPDGKLVIGVGSGIPIFSLFGWLHILKKSPDIFRSFRGKQLTAPSFLDNFVNQNIPKTDEAEESHLASHYQNRTRAVCSLIRKAGFRILKTEWMGHQNFIETPEQFWEIQRTFSSISRKRLSSLSSSKFEFLRANFLEECRAVQSRGGRLVYPFGAFYVTAQVPKN